MCGMRPEDAPGTGLGADLGGGGAGPAAGLRRVGMPAPGEDLPRGSDGRRLPPEGGRGGAMEPWAASYATTEVGLPASHFHGTTCCQMQTMLQHASRRGEGREGCRERQRSSSMHEVLTSSSSRVSHPHNGDNVGFLAANK